MIGIALASLLVLGAPDGKKISYKKKVMIDPSYVPSQSLEEIDETLHRIANPPRPQPVVYETAPVYRRRTPHWSLPISLGLSLGYGRHHGWNYGISVGYPGYGIDLGLAYFWGGHRHRHHYRHGGRARLGYGYRGGGRRR